MRITSRTGALGLIGHPVGHSKSPDMVNHALHQMKEPFIYLAYDVAPEELKEAVHGLKALKFRGWNVTIPHKVAIMEYLDQTDVSASEIGAVNTVVYDGDKWVGYNTDGAGYLRSLLEEVPLQAAEQRVVLLGAGGAARAVGYSLATAGVQNIVIANRTVEKAEQLAEHLSRWTDAKAVSIAESEKVVMQANLVINTTSVGMFPKVDETPIPVEWLHADQVVSDLIYHPRETTLLKGAKEKGARIHTGLGMLVHQAAVALELWTGKKAPISLMKQVLEESLAGKREVKE